MIKYPYILCVNKDKKVLYNYVKIFILSLLLCPFSVFAQNQISSPHLAFTDLISGPNNNLGDGRGNGAIVTVWGQFLGTSASNRQLTFTDNLGVQFEPEVYYWKSADGQLPSGPANLFASHNMQEIAFSVPAAAMGLGNITVTVDGKTSNALPFTVRAGEIYHVKSTGSNSGDGSWSDPWLSINDAVLAAPAGSTIYLHDVDAGSANTIRAIFWNNIVASSSKEAQFSVVSYPGFQPTITAQRGIEAYKTEAMVISKLSLQASNYTSVDANDQPIGTPIDTTNRDTFAIKTSKFGRAVGNLMTDIPGGCASSVNGAIMGTAMYGDLVSDFRAYGNEIFEYGCAGSSKLHHTTYMNVRSAPHDTQVLPWVFGWNYLHDNPAKFGIHQFDQDANCGDPSDALRIHNNVITNQGGAGISIGSSCWEVDAYIENNVLINVGLAAAWDGIDPNTTDGAENGGIAIRDSGLIGTMHISNNLILGYSADGQTIGGRGCLNLNGSADNVNILWNNNICYATVDVPFISAGYLSEPKLDNVSGTNNIWYYSEASPSLAIVPSWDTQSLLTDPMIQNNSGIISLLESANGLASPIIDQGDSSPFTYDIYGNPRDSQPDIGPVEFNNGTSAVATLATVTASLGKSTQSIFKAKSGEKQVLKLTLSADRSDTVLKELTLQVSGTINEQEGIKNATLYADDNGNGINDENEAVAVGVFIKSTRKFIFLLDTPYAMPMGERDFLITYSF